MNKLTLGRIAAVAGIACAIPLAGCTTMAAGSDEQCARWRTAVEPRVTVAVDLHGRPKPTLVLTTRQICVKREHTA